MSARSYLFVPSDSERKLAKGEQTEADALILDLEDSVAGPRKPEARRLARAYLDARSSGRAQELWVRINPLSGGEALLDLAAVAGGRPDGIVLPKADSAADVVKLDHYLSALETREDAPAGAIGVMVVATETARSMFALGGYLPGLPRLKSLTWGAEDLSAAVGAVSNSDDQGRLTYLYEQARALCVCASAAAEVAAVDTAYMGLSDPDGLEANCRAAVRDGFIGKLAVHPDQVPIINRAFSPSDAQVADARAVVAAFADSADTGVARLEGRMLDLPHLKQAQRTLALAAALQARGA